jgi:aryl carrier-like protein
MERMFNLMQVVERLPFPVKLWTVQNDYDALRRLELSARARRAGQEDREAGRWVARFRKLGERLGFSESALAAAPGEH